MKNYTSPTIEIILFTEDALTASTIVQNSNGETDIIIEDW